ncbi:MAG: endonuclease [Ferruginibacter sp.]
MIRKITLVVTILLLFVRGTAQIPAGYYNAAASKTGDSLRAALRDIITAGSVKLPYTSSSFDVWDAYSVTDTRPANNTIIWDMYSDIPTGSPVYNYTIFTNQCGTASAEGNCYSREHQMPNSWWGGLDDANNPQYTDLHHLPPADQYVNNMKSAHPIGQTNAPTWTSTNGSKVGPCSWPGYNGTVFEPIDAYKGDFARAYLYLATRYMNTLSSWVNNNPGTEGRFVIDTTNNYKQWFIDMLVQWSINDPVSQKEIDRNNAIYYNTPQHNRNPYIDHPEYVCIVWSSASCSSGPYISSILQSPLYPNSLNTVTVSASVTSTIALSSVSLVYGSDGINFTDTIPMNPGSGSTYVTATAIPASAAGAVVYYRIIAVDISSNTSISYVNSYTVLKEEPSAYPVNFACVTGSSSSISLTWVDAAGVSVPDGYLVKASNISLASIVDPVDGVAEQDGSFIKNIPAGSQSTVFTGLASASNYYFKIYPYTNSGSNINYKTTAVVPSTSCVTAVSPGGGCAPDLIISEYVEGSGSNKYIEIANYTGADVNLSNYRLRLFSNGSATPTNDILLSGTLNNQSVIVYKNASATIYTGTTTSNAAVNFNGDDAVGLYKISAASYVDIFGRIGEDPGAAWTSGAFSTVDKTLVRNATVTSGITVNPASGFPTLSTEWTQYATDVVSNLGSHIMSCPVCSSPTVNANTISFSSVGQSSMTINWINGDGNKRIVVMKAGSAITGVPLNATSYSANSIFGSGDVLNAGEYIVYNNTGSSVNITNLAGGQTYYFTIFEYNCAPGSEIYLTPGVSSSRQTYSIITGTSPESQYCVTSTTGYTTTIDFAATGSFTGNTFSVQLSDAAGSFASPVTIGTLVSNLNSETITCTIPANTASGTGYLMRVVSSSPVVTGSVSNPFEIILSSTAQAPVSVVSDRFGFCSDDAGNITLTATGGSGNVLSWFSGSCGGTFVGSGNPLVIPSPSATTTYYARWATACSNSSCAGVTVSVSSLPTVSAGTAISSCSGVAAIAMTGATSTGTTNNWSGGVGLGTWTQNANPALATFTPSVSAGSFIATLTATGTGSCPGANATAVRTISWGTAGTWTGAISTDWFNAGNWCGGVPLSTTNIIIPPSSQLLFSPTIGASNARCQNITLSGSLSVANGFNLDVNGNWTNSGGSLVGSTGTISFKGISKTIGGTASTQFPGIVIGLGASYTMNNNNSATGLSFSQGATSSLTLGNISFTVNGNVTVSNATFNATNSWNINTATVSVTGNVTVGSGTSQSGRVAKIAVTSGVLTITGNLTYSGLNTASAIVDLSGGAATLNLGGNIVLSSAGTLLPGTSSTVNYNSSTAAQTVTTASAVSYCNLTLNNTSASGVTPAAAITATKVTGNLSVQSGIFNNGGFGIAGNTGKQFSVSNGAVFRLTGNSSMPTGFGLVLLGATSTVDFAGTQSQTIGAFNYGHLTSTSTGARVLTSSGIIGVVGIFSPGTNPYTVTGSTMSFNGSNQVIPVFNGSTGYNNLSVTQLTGNATAGGNLTVSGTLTLNSGSFMLGSNVLTLNGASAIAGAPFSAAKMIVADGGGELRKSFAANGSYLFPVGDNSGTAEYSPVTLNFTSGIYATGAYAAVKVTNAKHPANANSTNYLNRYWTITNSSITNPVFNIDATYVAADISGSDGAISMGKYAGAIPWIKYNVANQVSKTISATAVSNAGSVSFTGISTSGPSINITGGNTAICNGAGTQLTASASGSTSYTYSWSPATGLSATNISNPVASPTTTTTYTVTVTDGNGFTSATSTTITVNPLPIVDFTGLAATYCNTDAAVTLSGSPSGGSFSGPGINGNTFSPGVAGAGGPYTITYIYTNPSTGCSNSIVKQVSVTACSVSATLNLTLFLEGFYTGSNSMNANIFDLGMSADPTASDNIQVNLWSAGSLSNSLPDYTGTALLHTNGTATIQFPAAVLGNSYYIAVVHRNSIETWSKLPVLFSSTTNYDFSTGLNKAYDDAVNPPMKNIGGGKFAFYAGDANQDGTIDGQDMNLIDNNIGFFGYDNSDVNGDGATDGQDMNFVDNNAQLGLFYARPY